MSNELVVTRSMLSQDVGSWSQDLSSMPACSAQITTTTSDDRSDSLHTHCHLRLARNQKFTTGGYQSEGELFPPGYPEAVHHSFGSEWNKKQLQSNVRTT